MIVSSGCDETSSNEFHDVVNLPEQETGVVGTISISTLVWCALPAVRWFPDRASDPLPHLIVSISEHPQIVNLGVPVDVTRRMTPPLIRWMVLNQEKLLTFWANSVSLTRQEIMAHVGGFQKLAKPRRGRVKSNRAR